MPQSICYLTSAVKKDKASKKLGNPKGSGRIVAIGCKVVKGRCL